MKIAIDINGVINDMDQLTLAYASEFAFRRNKKLRNANAFLIRRMTTLSEKDINDFKCTYRPLFLQTVKVRPFVVQVIDQLRNQGHTIYLMTNCTESSKKYGAQSKDDIIRWLIRHGVHYDKLIFTNHKELACVDYRVQLLIDDNPLLFPLIKEGCYCFCYETRYNRFYYQNNVIHVHSWYDILEKIEHWDRTIVDFEHRKIQAKIRE